MNEQELQEAIRKNREAIEAKKEEIRQAELEVAREEDELFAVFADELMRTYATPWWRSFGFVIAMVFVVAAAVVVIRIVA